MHDEVRLGGMESFSEGSRILLDKRLRSAPAGELPMGDFAHLDLPAEHPLEESCAIANGQQGAPADSVRL
jgi:hypothetical protein